VLFKISITGLNIAGGEYIKNLILPLCAGISIFFLFKEASFKFLSACCFLSIFIEHIIFSIRAIILLYTEISLSEFLSSSLSAFIWIGSLHICLAVLGCLLMLKLKNYLKLKSIKDNNV